MGTSTLGTRRERICLPQNPGPLNPQMLAIKSLSTMRELSPDYLNRFVSYVDTLLWLERSEAQPDKSVSKGRTSESPEETKHKGKKAPRRRS